MNSAAGFSQAPRPHRRGADQDGRRCTRRRGALDSPCHRPAHQVHRRRRKAGCLRAVSSRPHCRPHPRHGRHDVADREGRIHARPQEVRGVRQEGAARRRLLARRFPRPVAADQEARVDGEHFEDAALGRPLRRPAAGLEERGREAVRASRSDHQLDDPQGAPQSRDHLAARAASASPRARERRCRT